MQSSKSTGYDKTRHKFSNRRASNSGPYSLNCAIRGIWRSTSKLYGVGVENISLK